MALFTCLPSKFPGFHTVLLQAQGRSAKVFIALPLAHHESYAILVYFCLQRSSNSFLTEIGSFNHANNNSKKYKIVK